MTTTENIIDLIKKSRSVRRFDESKAVDSAILRQIVDTARLTASARNMQPLKYVTVTDDNLCEEIFNATMWAGALSDGRPEKGERPRGYIIICQDKNIAPNSMWDQGIVSYTMSLAATTHGLGACIIASIVRDKFPALNLPDNVEPAIVLALGYPVEDIRIVDMKDGLFNYYRDENGVHYVPKRTLSEVLLKEF